MDYKKIEKKFLKYNSFMKAIGINLCSLVIALFAFEPTPKQDDYDQAMVLYGGFTGEYSAYSQYTNFIFSKLIQILMRLFPMISWYYVVQYIFVFASLTVITFVFIKKANNKKYLILVSAVLIFCCYEIYIRFTFTKVAGICIIAGFLFLLYLIENQKKTSLRYIIGIIFIFVGIIIRGSMYKLIAEIFFSAFIIYIITGWKKIGDKRTYIFKIFIFILIAGSMYCCNVGLDLIDTQIRSKDIAWKNYIEKNESRVALQDYGMPEYTKNIKEYCAIGVTENDYNAWKNEGIYTDYDFFTPDLLHKIKKIKYGGGKISVVQKAFKGLLNYYLNDTGIYLFFAAIIFLIIFRCNYYKLYLLLVGGCCLCAYLYMYYLGRLQHHVDVMVLIAGAIILFYYCLPIPKIELYRLKQCYLMFGIIIIIFTVVNFNGLSYSSYYGSAYGSGKSQREEYERNKKNLELLSEDTEHLYLIGAFSTDYIYNREWTIFDVVKPGYYHNMISSNLYHLPHVKDILDNYSIDNIYQKITNSETIYAVSVDENSTFIDTLCTYINEHYQKKVYYTKVKKIDNINVYRFTSGNMKPLWKGKMFKNSTDVISDINIERIEDNQYTVEGYAYIEGVDSYAQNIYIAIEDIDTGRMSYSYALQSENDLFLIRDKYQGRYSKFYGAFSHDGNIQISIYIETKDSVYQLKVQN